MGRVKAVRVGRLTQYLAVGLVRVNRIVVTGMFIKAAHAAAHAFRNRRTVAAVAERAVTNRALINRNPGLFAAHGTIGKRRRVTEIGKVEDGLFEGCDAHA